jgi:hypothetical protein
LTEISASQISRQIIQYVIYTKSDAVSLELKFSQFQILCWWKFSIQEKNYIFWSFFTWVQVVLKSQSNKDPPHVKTHDPHGERVSNLIELSKSGTSQILVEKSSMRLLAC